VKSCQETVDFPTPAGPVIHKTGTKPTATILGSSRVRVNWI
jgi:hypothetical protein